MNWNQVYQHKNKELVQILASFAGLTERLPLRISMSNTRSGEPGDTVQFYPEGCSNVLFSIQFYPDLLHFKWFKKTLERYGQEAALREILLNQIAPALSGSRMPHDTATEMRVELRPKDKPLTQQIIQAVFPVIREVCEQAGSSSRKSKPVPRVELSEEGAKDRRGEGVSDSSDSIGDQPTLGGQTAGPYALFPGQSLGQYKIIRPLGRGGMGEVYEVEHQVLRRRYALKLLPVDFMKGSNALQRFQREAQVMANLEHPNIIKVDDFGETDGRYWLRMELAEGLPEEGDHSTTKHTKGTKGEGDRIVTLADLAKAYDGKIPQETLLPILWQVLQALDYAHGHGAVHRDLKPSNILLATKNTKKHEKGSSEFAEVKNCTAKISDFGLVKLVGEEWLQSMVQLSVQRSMSIGEERTEGGEGGSEGSSTRSMLGTYEYMSPEQKRGEEADARSDLYSVGLMAYRLLTGRANVLKLPSRVDAALSSGWDDFVEQALEELPEERLQSAKEGLKLLDRVEQDLDGGLEKEQQVTVPPLPVRGQGTEVGGQEEKLTPVRDSARETRENNAKEKHSVDPAIRPKKKSGWKWVVGLIIAIAGFGWIGSLMDSSSQPAPSQPARQPAPQTRTEPARQASAPAATRTPESARQQNNPTAGNVLGMAFVEVKAGSFQMGSNNGDSYEKPVHQDPFEAAYDAVVNNGDSDEKPEHRVTLTQPFWMAKTEVTQAQYKKVMGSNPSKFKGAQNPVEQVSWNDAMNFCKKLTEIERKAGRLPEGFEYALPTEAQWEYACQAGTTGDYAGNLDAMAWYSSNSESKTHPVGTKQPNAWGLYDMHGNVWEWCSDWYGDYASGSVTDPPGASSGSYRVRRGGSWFDFASLCRSAHRYGSDPTHTFYGLGFRVVVAAPLL